jgi:subtilisin family serine protease
MRYKSRRFILLHGLLCLRSIMGKKVRPRSRPQRLWKLAALACSAVLAVQAFAGTAIAQPAPFALAPVQNEGAPNQIPGQYIVVFRPGTARNVMAAAQDMVKALGGTVGHTYTSALIGFSVKLPAEAAQAQRAMEALRALPGVAYIEADQKVSGDTAQLNPPTGLDRIDRRFLPLNGSFTYTETGLGVHVYVIDSGILDTHVEFGGRASGTAVDFVNDGFGPVGCHGHGTHVAGTIGGATYGVAKNVNLHSVRVLDCGNSGSLTNIVAAVDWVTNPANRVLPAVANMSLNGPVSTTLDNAVTTSITSGVTYVVAAGNNGADGCNFSPTRVPMAITVGATDPSNDTRAGFSNWGTCLDLFAPGVGILSAWNTSNTATNTLQGTSMAAPHVTGCAALHLQNFPLDSPAQVWARLLAVADVSTTAGWPGIINPGVGSPNVLLHCGSLNDLFDDGDPHLTTVEGIHYDFQSAGEFVVLRDGNGLEIQTRQSPVTTQPPVANPYTGLATCVSLNTAIAARVGTHRVTYQPSLGGPAIVSGLQLRVDGVLTTLGAQPINLGPGARVMKSAAGNGIEIDFPDGTNLTATSNLWGPPHNRSYINLSVFRTPASEGIMGALASGSWLPALPNGTSLGPKPAVLHQRYVDLYQTFANAWRVTSATSLFDYAPGTSTTTFTLASWPPENPPCVVLDSPPTKPVDANVAQNLCAQIVDTNRKADCVFDVGITGEPGFAKLYLVSQQLQVGSTRTTVTDNKDPTVFGEAVTFTATVALRASSSKGVPTGAVQFTLDGAKTGNPVKLNATGQATRNTSQLAVGNHRVGAQYIPVTGSAFLASSSFDKPHTVSAVLPPPTGSLTVKKTISAPPGGGLPNLTGVVFPVNVVCTPSGPTTSVTLTAPTLSQVIPNIPVGSTCNVVEQPLASTGMCGRPMVSVVVPPTTYVPGQNVTITAPPAAASVEVRNVMACVSMGVLRVEKKMATTLVATPPIPPGITFPVQVACTPSGPNQTVNLIAAAPSVTLNIIAGSVCTLTELPPVGRIPSNCQWGPVTYPVGQSATIPAQSTIERFVQNTLVCGPPRTGSLTVKKTVSAPPGGGLPDFTGVGFPVNVVCAPSGPSTSVTLTTANPSQVIPNIPVGSNCNVVEPPVQQTGTCGRPLVGVASPPTYVPGQNVTITAPPATPSVEVHNVIGCVAIPPSACVLDPGVLGANNTFQRRATLAQTFRPTQTGALTQITHRLHKVIGTVDNYDLLVTTTTGALPSWTGGSTSTPNVLLAMTGLTIFATGSSNGVVQIPAGQQPHLIAGTQYALILIPGAPTTGAMYWQGNVDATSYPNGSAYELSGTTWSVPGTGPKIHGFKLDGQCP